MGRDFATSKEKKKKRKKEKVEVFPREVRECIIVFLFLEKKVY